MDLVGVGIDLVDTARIERMLVSKGDRVVRRLLTESERAYVRTMISPARHIAARIAAKEATYKALQALPGARPVGWQDLEVVRDTEGRPAMQLGGLAQRLADQFGPLRIELSLTHSDSAAAAVVVVVREKGE